MPRIPIVKAKDFHKYLLKYGCLNISTNGSHHKVLNPKNNKSSVVAIHAGKDVDKGAFSGVLNQLGIDVQDFIDSI